MVYLKVHLSGEDAKLPTRVSLGAAGYDLYSTINIIVKARSRALISTGIKLSFSSDHYVRIAPRSGLALKKGIDVGAGVIDSDYRGEIGVILFNHEDVDFDVRKGDRVAQMILTKIDTPTIEIVGDEKDLLTTERGTGGFGSSGK